jgi:tripartite-type tricarboxylate transporter receptor subunit TctC
MTDMIGGQVKVMFDTIPSVLQHVNAGSLKAIATTGREPSPFMPDYPTAIGQGLSDFEIGSWFGVLAPLGTPQPIIDKLNAEIGKALKSPKALEAMKLQGVTPKPGTPAEAAALIESEMQKWSAVIKATGLKAE